MPPVSASSTSTERTAANNNGVRPFASTNIAPPPPPTQPDGAKVREAEKMLKRLGHHPGNVDRHASENTDKAIKNFQRAVGLEPTGLLDNKTMDKLQGVYKRAQKHGGRLLGAGQQSAKIEKMEKQLRRLGYDTGRVDGLFDQQTADAVKRFKADDHIGKRPHQAKVKTGLAGTNTQRALEKDSKELNHIPYRVRVKPSKVRRADDRRVDRAIERTDTIKRGNVSKATEVVQRHLVRAGFDPQSIGGRFDERTEGMVKEFQKKSGLEPTGQVDARTWRKLKGTTIESNGVADPKQAIGEKSNAVKRTEQMLDRLGYDVGKVDGLYSEKTERAADRFRKKRGMPNLDGVGERTFSKIRKAFKKKTAANTNTVAGCAKFLLRSGNVNFWTGLSTGSDEKNFKKLARGEGAYVNATGQTIKPSLRLMQSLVEMAKKGPIMINALTGGSHSSNSNHYRGVAVDLDLSTGNAGMIESVARKYGGIRNYETTHIHIDY